MPILWMDSYYMMDILCQSRNVNISSTYLLPGCAFGGSCLPKDLAALLHQANCSDLSLPLLEGSCQSNKPRIQRTVEMVCATGVQRVGLIDLSFKLGSDDFRGSPLALLAQGLHGKGFKLKIYESDVVLVRLPGETSNLWSLQFPTCPLC